MATFQELLAQKAELEKLQADLEKQIVETQRAERQTVISQIRALMADHGLSAEDLAARPGRQPRAAASEDRPARKVAAKFRDADTGETWSGRGLKPRWLTAALESGRTLEDFAV